MSTALITHRDCQRHDMGRHHPECPERLQAIEDQLIASGVIGAVVEHEAPLADRAHLVRVHAPDYVDAIAAASPVAGIVHLDPDTAMNPYSYTAALRAAGASVLATDLVLQGKARNAFCYVRPRRATTPNVIGRWGFASSTTSRWGAAHALEVHGLDRVAVVDFDVHHGNGTEDIFRDDERVLMVSTFQHPFYPYSGIEGRSERMVNIPLPAYTDGAGVQTSSGVAEPGCRRSTASRRRPSSSPPGFDAHRADRMALLGLVEADYAWVTERMSGSGRGNMPHGRIVSMLEGGYNLERSRTQRRSSCNESWPVSRGFARRLKFRSRSSI